MVKNVVFALGEQLLDMELEKAIVEKIPSVILTRTQNCREILKKTAMQYEGDVNLNEIYFCQVETQQEYLYGAFSIVHLEDILAKRYSIMFFLNENYIVIVDDSDFSLHLIHSIQKNKIHQGETKEQFLYNFISEFLSRDMIQLEEFERSIMKLEEEVTQGKTEHFQSRLMPVRKKLLLLRGYYDQLADVGKELEENENGFFTKKRLKYFGTVADRADRMMNKTIYLLEYAQQVRDLYQSEVDAKQNRNMQFLTVISTVFFPLTVITGWFGMNFKNMPEMENGYTEIKILSICSGIDCIIIFKKKKIL